MSQTKIRIPGGSYAVIDPNAIYRGKSYSSWVCDWFNSFLSADSHKRNRGPVVFLWSLGTRDSICDTSVCDPGKLEVTDDQNGSSDDPYYPRKYENFPNIRVGSDRLQITADQGVLVPIITSHSIASEAYADLGLMLDYCIPTIDTGDDPPDPSQLTINNRPITIPRGLTMKDFRILTSVFTAVVPSVEYGRSLNSYMEMPERPGAYPAVVEGYFVLLKFQPGTYFIHSWASSMCASRLPYSSQLLYQIEVFPEKQSRGRITEFLPLAARNNGIIQKIFHEKQKLGQFGKDERKLLQDITGISLPEKRGGED